MDAAPEKRKESGVVQATICNTFRRCPSSREANGSSVGSESSAEISQSQPWAGAVIAGPEGSSPQQDVACTCTGSGVQQQLTESAPPEQAGDSTAPHTLCSAHITVIRMEIRFTIQNYRGEPG
jgi:hypothetical protein